MPVSGTVLGLGCGQPHGSAEILLKAALRAAEAEGAQVELVRLDELRLPSGAAEGAIIEGLTALRREGREPAVPFRVDERVLKSRVAGFLAVGGSLTSQWKTLALPIMHT